MPYKFDLPQFASCLFDNAGDAMLVFEPPQASVIDANDAALRLTGYARRRLLQTTLGEIVAPDVGGKNLDLSEIWRGGATWSCCDGWHVQKTDGSDVPVEVQIHRVDSNSKTLGVAVLRDATSRKQAEARLKECECKFSKLFAAAPDAIFVEDLDGEVLDVNPAACTLHGLEREELIGKNVLDLVPPKRKKEVRRDFAKLVSGEVDHADGFSRTGDGRAIPVELRVSQIEYEGRPALLLHVRDVSHRRHAERVAQQSASATARTALLSPRECQVKDLVVAGKTNRTISEELGISTKTVECHRANMMRKLGVKTVADLVRLALTAQQLPDNFDGDEAGAS